MEKSQSANNEENRSNIQIDYNCSICFDSNWVRVNVPFGHPRWGTIEPCKCWNERNEDQRDNRLRLYSNLNMLKKFTFDTLDASTKTNDEIDKDLKNAVEYGNNFAENPQGWGYAVFGTVIEGFETVEAIAAVTTGSSGHHQDVPLEDITVQKTKVTKE